MGETTKIEWTDATWNPIRARNLATGKIGWHCEHATTGCEFCYAEGMNKRLGTGLPFRPGHRKDIEIFLDETMLLAPLHWKRPRKIFVGSMTDLFADFVTDAMLDKMFAVMALCPQHTFQPLTKRAARMLIYFRGRQDNFGRCSEVLMKMNHTFSEEHHEAACDQLDLADLPDGRPQHNVWLGVSCERQEEYNERWPLLRATPAAVRFISYEPALGPLIPNFGLIPEWIICGGESGGHARMMNPQWARDLRDRCKVDGIAFFMKQMTGKKPIPPDLMVREFPR